MDVLIKLEVAGFLEGSSSLAITNLNGKVLDASELNVATDLCIDEGVHSG